MIRSLLSCVSVSADDRVMVSGHENGTFQLWDTKSGEQVGVRIRAHDNIITCISINNDGGIIVTGSADRTLHLWDAKELFL